MTKTQQILYKISWFLPIIFMVGVMHFDIPWIKKKGWTWKGGLFLLYHIVAMISFYLIMFHLFL